MYQVKQKTLAKLEEGLGTEMVEKLKRQSIAADGSQYRPKTIEQPTRASILKLLQVEGGYGLEYSALNTRATRSVGINRGLEVEIRQYLWLLIEGSYRIQFKHESESNIVTTDVQWNRLQDTRRKLSQVIDG
ncbi:hypothetical protein M422DRAFT_42992 [Sphaerobolus stellatus SS14]|nr:hypothetical protein M422DRAFT_42992 [Sphaerobolus stellatus SS14]